MEGDRVGRGGLKLEAALDRFRLDERVRGARAVDVGASTGGFTETLLRRGAARVTAVDVGHGQLHPSLASDARVENLERVHWKTAALTVAAGPYDFFTVDVSFAAARTMLRGLAFRLRDGAEGVVLIKPQFELPDGAVRGGDVSDPQLRARAVEKVREKAESLGFVVVEYIDSPVAGSSGTIEILAHLRFVGRSERLPKPGEKKSSRPARDAEARGGENRGTENRDPQNRGAENFDPQNRSAENFDAENRGAKKGGGENRGGKRKELPSELRCFAVAAPGLEAVVAAEVAALDGARAVQAVPGGVEFSGAIEVVWRANLWLRTATRVLVRVGEFEAREFPKLRRRAEGLPWAPFLDGRAPVALHVSQSRSRLYHTGAIAENLEAALADAAGARVLPKKISPDSQSTEISDGEVPGEGAIGVFARGLADRWTLSVDASGELLHRRGWRAENAAAPLRETLAAALLHLCEWDPATPLVDPMCGAGTIPVEACALAMRLAPGLRRGFAFERWPTFDAARFAAERATAESRALASPPAPIVGADHAARAVEAARRNADRAGLLAHVQLFRAELSEAQPPPGARPGLLLVNPPYGRRLGDDRVVRALLGELGRLLRARFKGWRAGVLVADRRLDAALGLRPSSETPLQNGGLRVRLLRFAL